MHHCPWSWLGMHSTVEPHVDERGKHNPSGSNRYCNASTKTVMHMIESTDNGVNQSDYVLVCSPSSITSSRLCRGVLQTSTLQCFSDAFDEVREVFV